MHRTLLLSLCAVTAAVDHSMKLQRTLGTASIAAKEKNYDLALTKIEQLAKELGEWKDALIKAKEEDAAPAAPEQAPQPPEESIDFSINSTFVPDKCQRKSEDGAVMKVHYVGKLVKTGKIFGSSFHTGSQPFRFVLGSDDVLSAWNKGLQDMCVGERRRLMVPWNMGYGEKGGKGVPPYSDLQFDFELTDMSLPKMGKAKSAKSSKGEL